MFARRQLFNKNIVVIVGSLSALIAVLLSLIVFVSATNPQRTLFGYVLPKIVFKNYLPALEWDSSPFSFESTIVVNDSVIEFEAKTSAPNDSVFKVFATRELVSRAPDRIKMSILPHVGDIVFSSPISLSFVESQMSSHQSGMFGLVKDGVLKFTIKMFHPYIQAFGQSLDSVDYSFEKFSSVMFKVSILRSREFPPKSHQDMEHADWVDFKVSKLIPIPVYSLSPSAAEIAEIEKQHNERD